MTHRFAGGQIYVYAVIALGAVVMTSALSSLQFSEPGLFATLLVLSVVSSALKVDMPLGAGGSCISLSYIVDFTALLLFGPGPTMLIAVTSGWSQCTLRMQERNPIYKTLFSMAALAMSVAAAGATYTWLGGTYGTLPAAPLQPLMAAAMIYFLVNSTAVAGAFAISSSRNVVRLWHDNFLWTVSSYVVGSIAAGIAVEVLRAAGQWQTLLALIPLCLTYRSYRIYHRRIKDEQRQVAEWTQLHRDSTEVLARAIQAKDDGGSCHVERVQYYATALARRLDLPDLDRQAVEIGALLHDIGKLAVPEHILSKPGPLTPDERKKMQMHAQIGAQIVGAVPFPCPVAPLVRSHHERWDGSGYPSGLRGQQIPIGARILSVVDCFDALTSDRPYRPAISKDDAIRILEAEAGKAFDPAVVARFAEVLPMLTPPRSDGFLRRPRLSREPASDQLSFHAAERSDADAFAEIASANRENYALYEIAQSMGRSTSLTEMMTLVSAQLSTACALLVVCALRPACGRGLALQVRDRSACRTARGCVDRGSQRLERMGRAASQAARQRAAGGGVHRRRCDHGRHPAPVRVDLSVDGWRRRDWYHRRVPPCHRVGTRRIIVACSIRWRVRRRQECTTRCCSSVPRNRRSKTR